MVPRFVNPHFLLESTTIVSRNDIYAEEDSDDEYETQHSNIELVNGLNKQLHTLWEPTLSATDSSGRSRKRRKLEQELEQESIQPVKLDESPVPFRLVSILHPPHPILLFPKPPPPPITREPDCEDDEAQAIQRMKCAQAAAVDFHWIIKEKKESKAAILLSRDSRKHRYAKVASGNPTSPTSEMMMIIELDQPLRMTRPPVDLSELTHHPYTRHGPILPIPIPPNKMGYPRIQVEFQSSEGAVKTKRRRKRGKMSRKERLQPTFWRPNPWCGGKSMGYAMGYPCSLGIDTNYY